MSKHWTERVAEALAEWVDPDEWTETDSMMTSGEDCDTPGWSIDHLGMTMEAGSFELTADLINRDYNKTARAMLAALDAFNEDR